MMIEARHWKRMAGTWLVALGGVAATLFVVQVSESATESPAATEEIPALSEEMLEDVGGPAATLVVSEGLETVPISREDAFRIARKWWGDDLKGLAAMSAGHFHGEPDNVAIRQTKGGSQPVWVMVFSEAQHPKFNPPVDGKADAAALDSKGFYSAAVWIAVNASTGEIVMAQSM